MGKITHGWQWGLEGPFEKQERVEHEEAWKELWAGDGLLPLVCRICGKPHLWLVCHKPHRACRGWVPGEQSWKPGNYGDSAIWDTHEAGRWQGTGRGKMLERTEPWVTASLNFTRRVEDSEPKFTQPCLPEGKRLFHLQRLVTGWWLSSSWPWRLHLLPGGNSGVIRQRKAKLGVAGGTPTWWSNKNP